MSQSEKSRQLCLRMIPIEGSVEWCCYGREASELGQLICATFKSMNIMLYTPTCVKTPFQKSRDSLSSLTRRREAKATRR